MMAANEGFDTILIRRAMRDDWTAINPVLEMGELGLEYTSADPGINCDRLKAGDGVTAWNDLQYVGRQLLPTSGTPADRYGRNKDWAIDVVAGLLYGPKVNDAWPPPRRMWPGTVTVNMLAAGSTPSGSYNTLTGVITLRIPATPGPMGKDGLNGKDGSDGKSVTVFVQSSQPTANRVGDIWIKTST